MTMYRGIVFKRICNEVGKEDGCVSVQRGQDQILLNVSASIVWTYIDGHMDTDAITQNILRLYQDDNTPEYIQSVVDDSITLLLDQKLIERAGAR